MKPTYVFIQTRMTVYPSMAMAEKNLGVHALRRTLQHNEGVAYVGDALVIRPESHYDYEYLNMMIEGVYSRLKAQ